MAAERASARMTGADGTDRGTIELQATARGVLVRAKLHGLPPGIHGFHLHAVGKCEPPFDSAGPHFNPRRTVHGILSAAGGHGGDLPNMHVPDSGAIDLEVLAADVSLTEGSLLDADGSSVVVHAGPDDYTSDPAGNSGARIACGVISPQGG
jgi:Cu-Zn family superoxide dismutase